LSDNVGLNLQENPICTELISISTPTHLLHDDRSFDLTSFKACLKENDIEAPKVDMERHGAIGRFRMCAGLGLRRHAAKVGFVVIDEKKIAAPGAKKRGRKAKAAATN
jgi:hypothetical protein